MKVALVTHDVIMTDGQGRVNTELVRYLAGAGHQVHLYANQVDPDLLRLDGIHWRPIPLRIRKPDLLKCAEFMVRVSALLRPARYDIVHLNGAVALNRHHVNSVHFVHRAWLAAGAPEVSGWRGLYHRCYRQYNAWLEGVVFRRTQRVAGVSPATAQELVRHFGLPPSRVTYVINGCDAPLPELAPAARHQLRAELWPGLADDDALIGFAGDLVTARKGIDTVLRSMRHFKGKRVRLVVAGAAAHSPYPALATLLGLDGQVRFLGFRKDLGRIFQALDCLVFPTRYEPFGLVVTEAAAAGCPLLISGPAYCGAAALFQEDVAAVFLRDPADDEELAEKLGRLLDQPEARARLGAEARRAVARWSWQQMGQAYEALYREVLQSPAR